MRRTQSPTTQGSSQQSTVDVCRQEIVRLDLALKTQILDIQKSNGPLSQLNKLTQAVKRHLTDIDERISEMETIALTAERAGNVESAGALTSEISKHHAAQKLNITNLREAQIMCMQRINKESKEQLLSTGSGNDGELRKRKAAAKSSELLGNAADVTDTMSSLLRVMDGQVKQSQETLENLVSSSQTIGSIDSETRSTGAAISSSGKLLSKYSRRELTDKILICLALLMFFGTAAYIFKKRFFGGGLI